MKEKLVAKVDEHINRLLAKPELTNEEYAILKERLREIKFAEEEAARKLELDKKMSELLGLVFSTSMGGVGCVQ